jgi:hypothetical protein
MDFLNFDTTFHVLICTQCQHALVPGTLVAHLGSLHKVEVTKGRCVEFRKDQPIQPTKALQKLDLSMDTPPIPHLVLFHNGNRYCLCTKSQKNTRSMQEHLKACWKAQSHR